MEEFEIRADYDERSIIVYQAYAPEIALPALKNQRFVPPFSLNRMTWIKPSYLWMMERSGWSQKPGQQMILAVRITRQGWEDALAQAVLTTFHPGVYRDYEAWHRQLEQAPVRVQWDPERTLQGRHPSARSIQVGLSRFIVERYVREWTLEIRDYTPLAKKMYGLLQQGQKAQAQTFLQHERVYTLESAIARRLGME